MQISFNRSRYLLVSGFALIFIGVIANPWMIGLLLSDDGSIDATKSIIKIWLFDVSLVAVGAVLIARRHRDGNQVVPIRFIVLLSKYGALMLVTLVLLNLSLYFFSPVLPESIVRSLSTQAQIRFTSNSPSVPWVYVENIRYAKPNTEIQKAVSDSFGYNNPQQYLEQNPNPDIVLLGDSFTWGTEQNTIADYLRGELGPMSVYSLGMRGEGIPQWRHHYERLASITELNPSVVILNFYSSNDINDTNWFLNIQRRKGKVDSVQYFGYLSNRQNFDESAFSWFVSFSEISSLLRKLSESIGDGDVPDGKLAALEGDQYGEYEFFIRKEPKPEQWTQEVADQLNLAVDLIRKESPQAAVLLSYIPSSAGLYGSKINNCADCGLEIERQVSNSLKLKNIAESLGINYTDVTAMLQTHTESMVLWAGTHFNPEGYRLYSKYLARAIDNILINASN